MELIGWDDRWCEEGRRKKKMGSATEWKTEGIIWDDENGFTNSRGQTVIINSCKCSCLAFNAGSADFMDRKPLLSKLWELLVDGKVESNKHAAFFTAFFNRSGSILVHWCILCIIFCLPWMSLPRIVECCRQQPYIQTVWVGSIPSVLFSVLSLWLSPTAGNSTGTCGDPGTPAYASREVGNFKVRSKVRFTCAVGHTLYGSAERICFPNGTWSGKQPFCKRKGQTQNCLLYGNSRRFMQTSNTYACI